MAITAMTASIKPQLPWQLHSALTDEHLRAIARLVQSVCHDAAQDHQPSKGDNAWALGCVRYARLCFRLRAAAEEELQEWLGIGESHDLYLLLTIGGVPARIYRGDADDNAPARYAQPHVDELHAIQLALLQGANVGPASERSFRFVYGTDPVGELAEIWFVQVDETGEVSNPWRIPLEPLTEVVSFRKAPIEPPPPVIEPLDTVVQQQGA